MDEPFSSEFAVLGTFLSASQAATTVPDVIAALRDCLRTLVPFDWGCLLLGDPAQGWLLHRAAEVVADDAQLQRLFHTATPVVGSSAHDLSPALRRALMSLDAPVGETLLLPLAGSAPPLLLILANTTAQRSLAAALPQIEVLATGLGLALAKQLIHATSERRQRDLQLFDQVRAAIASTLDLEQLCSAVVQQIAATYGYAIVGLFLTDGEQLALVGQVGCDPSIVAVPTTQGIVGRAFRTRSSQYVPDVAADPDFVVVAEASRSEIAVPLIVDDQVSGVLNVESNAASLTRYDLRIIEALATEFSWAIERARLYTAAVTQARQAGARRAAAGRDCGAVRAGRAVRRGGPRGRRGARAARRRTVCAPGRRAGALRPHRLRCRRADLSADAPGRGPGRPGDHRRRAAAGPGRARRPALPALS